MTSRMSPRGTGQKCAGTLSASGIWSAEIVQDSVISTQMFQDAQALLATRGRRSVDRKVRPAARPYALRGLLLCGICARKMQGPLVNNRAHYRCRYPSEYAASKELQHPRNVFLREDLVVPVVDRSLASLFAPAPSRNDQGPGRSSGDGRRPRASCNAGGSPSHRRRL